MQISGNDEIYIKYIISILSDKIISDPISLLNYIVGYIKQHNMQLKYNINIPGNINNIEDKCRYIIRCVYSQLSF